MRSGLYLTTAIPTVTLPDGVTVVNDPNYYVVTRIPGAVAIYGFKYLLHACPGAPPPPNVTTLLQDGSSDWHWLDGSIGVATNAVAQSHMLMSLWQEADGTHYGTVANRVARGVNVLQVYQAMMPSHEWLGDGL